MSKSKIITITLLLFTVLFNLSNCVSAQTTRTEDIKEPPFKYDTKNNTNNTKTPSNSRESSSTIKDKPNFIDPHTIKDPPYNRQKSS